jgi:hypothetical protein
MKHFLKLNNFNDISLFMVTKIELSQSEAKNQLNDR